MNTLTICAPGIVLQAGDRQFEHCIEAVSFITHTTPRGHPYGDAAVLSRRPVELAPVCETSVRMNHVPAELREFIRQDEARVMAAWQNFQKKKELIWAKLDYWRNRRAKLHHQRKPKPDKMRLCWGRINELVDELRQLYLQEQALAPMHFTAHLKAPDGCEADFNIPFSEIVRHVGGRSFSLR